LEQLVIAFARARRRGGSRVGAGRKKLPAHLRHTPHRARVNHRKSHPVHVTLRAKLRSLRSQQVARTVLGALRDSNAESFRIAHYSVQENHVHLIVEADTKASLFSGMRGLMVRVARRVNRLLFRKGRFWADRWHDHALTSPREVRNALVYVLQNRNKHASTRRDARAGTARGTAFERTPSLDPLSSAQWFDGFVEPIPMAFRSAGARCVVEARTWLLRIGWQRGGRIQSWEAPRGDTGG
jgi:putative transposase